MMVSGIGMSAAGPLGFGVVSAAAVGAAAEAAVTADLSAFGLELECRSYPDVAAVLTGLRAGEIELALLSLAKGRAALAGAPEIDWFVPRSALPAGVGGESSLSEEEERLPALFFRSDAPRPLHLRGFYVPAVAFVGGGPGDPGLCTVSGVEALCSCDVCLYDALVPASLLTELPAGARAVYVGKRCGRHSLKQSEICGMLAGHARRGLRVVRLKGGDPGIFGRLAEEIATFDAYRLPYRVVPGVSSLLAATTGTGMFLTRRGISRGFTVLTPRRAAENPVYGGEEGVSPRPLVFFMALGQVGELVANLRRRGRRADEPAAVVWGASTPDERIVKGSLGDIVARVEEYDGDLPGIFLVGAITAYGLNGGAGSALQGEAVLLLVRPERLRGCIAAVRDYGGRPVIPPPLLELSGIERRRPRFDTAILTAETVAGEYRRQWGGLPQSAVRTGGDELELIRALARERVAARLAEGCLPASGRQSHDESGREGE